MGYCFQNGVTDSLILITINGFNFSNNTKDESGKCKLIYPFVLRRYWSGWSDRISWSSEASGRRNRRRITSESTTRGRCRRTETIFNVWISDLHNFIDDTNYKFTLKQQELFFRIHEMLPLGYEKVPFANSKNVKLLVIHDPYSTKKYRSGHLNPC